MRHLVEAVASRRSGKYIMDFPDKPDIDDLKQFLENNGYKDAKREMTDEQLLKLALDDGVKYYSAGNHSSSEPMDHYIKWCDPKKDIVYFVRTVTLSQLAKSPHPDNILYYIIYVTPRYRYNHTNNWREFIKMAEKEMI